MTNLRHSSLRAINIINSLTDQSVFRTSTDNDYSLDSDDNFHSGCGNFSHYYRQRYLSGLHSLGRSYYTITIISIKRRNLSDRTFVVVSNFCIPSSQGACHNPVV